MTTDRASIRTKNMSSSTTSKTTTTAPSPKPTLPPFPTISNGFSNFSQCAPTTTTLQCDPNIAAGNKHHKIGNSSSLLAKLVRPRERVAGDKEKGKTPFNCKRSHTKTANSKDATRERKRNKSSIASPPPPNSDDDDFE